MRIDGGIGSAAWLDKSGASLSDKLSALGLGRAFGAPLVGTAAAANLAVAEIRNLSGSGKTCFFWGGDISVAASMGVLVLVDGTSIIPATSPVPLLTGGSGSAVLFGGSNQLAPTGTVLAGIAAIASGQSFQLPSDFWLALTPNHNLQIQGQIVNTVLRANLKWIELSA